MPASDVMVHEVTSTLYGVWFEKLNLRNGETNHAPVIDLHNPEDFSRELSVASEGWADFFSQLPFPVDLLIKAETAANQRGQTPERMLTVNSILGNRHAFVALALAKVEMAEGFPALVRLMGRPPGLVKNRNGMEFRDALDQFWSRYVVANKKLGIRSVRKELVFNGRKSLLPEA